MKPRFTPLITHTHTHTLPETFFLNYQRYEHSSSSWHKNSEGGESQCILKSWALQQIIQPNGFMVLNHKNTSLKICLNTGEQEQNPKHESACQTASTMKSGVGWHCSTSFNTTFASQLLYSIINTAFEGFITQPF